ncbi:hypothetical protein [Natrialba sp. PRR66]|uniref:hypothetical protein n=1 Tax=Natrialba sp. PRR66 TaxID=3098146 RepID=UPI002B1D2E0F|nr:hypothetical protein [Natrialba sp. PRR66]
MVETVDAQREVIGIGSAIAVLLVGYGTAINETIGGVRTTILATWVFAATFALLALLHGSYGRRDFAAAHGGAAVGLLAFLLATAGPQALVGLLVFVGSGAYIGIATLRARPTATS